MALKAPDTGGKELNSYRNGQEEYFSFNMLYSIRQIERWLHNPKKVRDVQDVIFILMIF